MPLLYLLDLPVSRAIKSLFVLLVIVIAAACDKVPLLAPTQSTITLSVSTTTLSVTGSAKVMATVIEQAGTPVQNGTTVTFTGSLGVFDPPEAQTVNGTATTTFRANGSSGIAKIGAVSGGAKATEVEVKIGGAAAETVTLRAEPTTVPATGGKTTLVASVSDLSGNPLSGAPVLFSTDNGQLDANSAVTDNNGEARTGLTTNRTAIVKARVGAKEGQVTINAVALPTVSIASSTPSPIVGLPVTFTVTPGAVGTTGNAIRNVVLDFGDGTPPHNFGAIANAASVSHVYAQADTYTVTATVTDITGLSQPTSVSITVQRAIVSVTFSNPPATTQVNSPVSFPVAVTNSSNAPLTRVDVEFGDGQSITLPPSGGTATHTYATAGTFTVRATARDQSGNAYAPASHVIRVDPATAFNVTLDAQPADPGLSWSCTPTTGYPKTCNTNFIGIGVRVLFTAGGTPAGFATITGYEWDFGDGTSLRTTSNSVDHIFRAPSSGYVITVRVLTTAGSSSMYLTLIITP
jgi:PKD repeat protein